MVNAQTSLRQQSYCYDILNPALPMRTLARLAAGFFLFTGIPFCLVGFLFIFTDKGSAVPFIFFVAWTAFGGWLAWNHQNHRKIQKNNQLRTTFLRLLKENDGRISILEFAADTGLSGSESKKYLDEQISHFNGELEVDDRGFLYYSFILRLSTKSDGNI